MGWGIRFVAVLVALVVVVSCEERQMAADDFPLGWAETCPFEATLPEFSTFEQVTVHFVSVNRQFCSWSSFKDRKLRGLAYSKYLDKRTGTEILSGVPRPGQKMCDVEPMISAGWRVRPLPIQPGEEMHAQCGGFGIQLNGPTTMPFTKAISLLPELCFRVLESHNKDAGDVIAFSSTLHTHYTLPVRFSRLEGDILRLWFDAGPDAAWAGEWPKRVVDSAKKKDLILEEYTCTT